MNRYFLLLTLLLILIISNSSAANIKISGFLTAGGTISDSGTNYDTNINNQLNLYNDSKVGLNFRSEISNNWSAAVQLLNAYDKFDQEFKLNADWAFASFRPNEQLTLKFGKQKLPVWLISDYYEVGLLYPWVRPPVQVYGLTPIATFTGINANYRFDIKDYTIDFEIYAGKTPFKISGDIIVDNATAATAISAANPSITCTAPCILSGTSSGNANLHGIKFAISNDNILIRTNIANAPTVKTIQPLGSFDYQLRFWEIGSKIDFNNSFIFAEYVATQLDDNHSGANYYKTHGHYLTYGHTFGIFTPHLTYAHLTVKEAAINLGLIQVTAANDNKEDAYTIGVTTKTTNASDFKIEYQKIKPTNYGYFFTTATKLNSDINIISAAFNMVF